MESNFKGKLKGLYIWLEFYLSPEGYREGGSRRTKPLINRPLGHKQGWRDISEPGGIKPGPDEPIKLRQ